MHVYSFKNIVASFCLLLLCFHLLSCSSPYHLHIAVSFSFSVHHFYVLKSSQERGGEGGEEERGRGVAPSLGI